MTDSQNIHDEATDDEHGLVMQIFGNAHVNNNQENFHGFQNHALINSGILTRIIGVLRLECPNY